MGLASVLAALNLALLLASLVGIWRHGANLRELACLCRGVTASADLILCRQYKRHERVRLMAKVGFALAALYLMERSPLPVDDPLDWWGPILLRLFMTVVVIALDWESVKSRKDRVDLGNAGVMP
jgi:hypothetical protein